MNGQGTCNGDSSCTAGTNGRCVESGGGVLFCACTYDTCMKDTDCPTGQTCACHGSPYDGSQGNACVPGNCRVDADCAPSGYCSPSYAIQGCGSLGGYYCHTPNDACIDDSDCASSQGPALCVYTGSAGRWTCQTQMLCG